MSSTPEGFTNNSPLSPEIHVLKQIPVHIKILSIFFNVRFETKNCCPKIQGRKIKERINKNRHSNMVKQTKAKRP